MSSARKLKFDEAEEAVSRIRVDEDLSSPIPVVRTVERRPSITKAEGGSAPTSPVVKGVSQPRLQAVAVVGAVASNSSTTTNTAVAASTLTATTAAAAPPQISPDRNASTQVLIPAPAAQQQQQPKSAASQFGLLHGLSFAVSGVLLGLLGPSIEETLVSFGARITQSVDHATHAIVQYLVSVSCVCVCV